MSEYFIPEQIDPYRYAEQQLKLHGLIKLSEMHRLSTVILQADQKGVVDLQFGVDEQSITYIKGRVQVTLSLQCQRCLEPYQYDITSDFSLGVVKSINDVNALPDHYEPVMAKEGVLVLSELIEDEIILNLPIIPKHEPEHCRVKLPLSGIDEEQGKNPFHILESLKHKK